MLTALFARPFLARLVELRGIEPLLILTIVLPITPQPHKFLIQIIGPLRFLSFFFCPLYSFALAP